MYLINTIRYQLLSSIAFKLKAKVLLSNQDNAGQIKQSDAVMEKENEN